MINESVFAVNETRGTFLIESNSRIIINKDVIISGVHDIDSYYADDSVFWDTCQNELGRSIFFANGKENIELVGEEGSVIDGQGALWTDEYEIHHRPSLLRFVNCKNVVIKNLTLINSPCWCIHLQNCENVTVDGLNVRSSCNHNNDGIDIDCCRNVIVKNCVFNNGDDAVVIKSTKNINSNNIMITDCKITSLGAGFKIGTETVGDISNVKFFNNEIVSSEGGSIKLMTTDGSNINGVFIKDVVVKRGTGPLFIANGYRMRKYFDGHTRDKAGSIKNIKIENLTADVYIREGELLNKGRGVLLITGTPDNHIENVEVLNCTFNMPGGETDENREYVVEELTTNYPEYYVLGVTPSYGAYVRHAKNVKIFNVKFNLQNPDVRKEIYSTDVDRLIVE